MKAPSFWWREASWAAAALAPAAMIYGTVAARRMRREGRAAGIPVICIGSLTVGGAGKTPTALALGEILAAEKPGEKPFFLTRGYGGNAHGPLTVDPARHGGRDVGDEPRLLARQAPTIVARDRVAGAAAAQEAGAGMIIMDDGFHSPSVRKDVAILVVDADYGIGNGYVLPAGPLRAPLPAQLAHAHALIVVGPGSRAAPVVAAAGTRPVFRARLAPDPAALAGLRGSRVLAFAGIGHPDKFFATLEEVGIRIAAKRSYGDHHHYTAAEAAALVAEAERQKLVLVTTEKDVARLVGDDRVATLAQRARAFPVRLVLEDEEGFRAFLRERLSMIRRMGKGA
jgi:tetraacyldisaccharide 4'-kinase